MNKFFYYFHVFYKHTSVIVTLVILTVKKDMKKVKNINYIFTHSSVNKQTKTTYLAEVYITTTKIPVTRSPGIYIAIINNTITLGFLFYHLINMWTPIRLFCIHNHCCHYYCLVIFNIIILIFSSDQGDSV